MTTADRQLIEHYVRRGRKTRLVFGLAFTVGPTVMALLVFSLVLRLLPQDALNSLPNAVFIGPLALIGFGLFMLWTWWRSAPSRHPILRALEARSRNPIVTVKLLRLTTRVSGLNGTKLYRHLRIGFLNGKRRTLLVEPHHVQRLTDALVASPS